jgi:WS/DGAT/MGAT family acyltransferase
MRGVAKFPFDMAGRALGAVRRPATAVRGAREAAEGVGEIVWAGLNPAPETPLNVPIGPHRRVRWVQSSLADFKEIKNELGGTVNDVVLSVVTGALRRWLKLRGVQTEGLELRALVPVSIRAEDEHHQLGNRIVVMRGPLPVYCDDPLTCLDRVREAMAGVKESKQALGAEVISGLEGFAPPTLLAQASRLNFSTRLFNLIVTNVPGPQFPLYILGREMLDIFPVAFLPEQHALAVAIMSYNGGIHFGLLADYDALPDVDEMARGLEDALAELVARAKEESGKAKRPDAGKASTRNGASSEAEEAPERA